MKKIKIILLLVLILTLLVGCTSLPGLSFLGGKQDKPVIGRGIKMYFMPGAPPTDKLLIGQDSIALVRVAIENYGPGLNGNLKFWDSVPGGIEGDRGVVSVGVTLKNGDTIPDQNTGQIIKIDPDRVFCSPDSGSCSSDNPSGTGEVQYNLQKLNIVPGMKLNVFAELVIDDYNVGGVCDPRDVGSQNSGIQTTFCLKREADTNVPCSNQEIITSSKLGQVASYVPVTVDRIEKTATPISNDRFFVTLKIVLKNLGGGEIVDDLTGKKDFLKNFKILVDGTDADRVCSPNAGQLVFNNNEAVINCAIKDLTAGQSFTDHTLKICYSFPYRLRIKAGPIPLSVIENKQV
ncbi:hypothetical protein HYV88_01645 [Candidatus Woesearchaeota archaeon]|nr:hypothetical protein [Candidatus Woesearchaeota archaeon]